MQYKRVDVSYRLCIAVDSGANKITKSRLGAWKRAEKQWILAKYCLKVRSEQTPNKAGWKSKGW